MREEVKKHIEEFKKIHNNKYDYSITNFEYLKDKIKYICPDHGVVEQRGSDHKSGRGCRKCKYTVKKKTVGFWLEGKEQKEHICLEDKNKEVKVTDKLKFKCTVHDYEYEQRFNNYLLGHKCLKCGLDASNEYKKSNYEEFSKKFELVFNGKYKLVSTEYKGNKEYVEVSCKKHGNFLNTPERLLIGKGCSKCSGRVSKKETEIVKFLEEYCSVRKSVRNLIPNKEVDILVEDEKICIEFNGLYWHSDKFLDNKYHLEKTKSSEELGYRMIHIFEDEWDFKPEIVKSRLLNLIGKTPNKIFARKTKVVDLSQKEIDKFLNENHIQGTLNSKFRYGLMYNGEIVSVMTFGSKRRVLGSKNELGHYELYRFCNKLYTNVVGGADKLLKHFERNVDYEELITYADRRWSKGELYYKIGFEYEGESKPGYFYCKGGIRESRFKYTKSKLKGDKNKTEKQLMKEAGYNIIFDCGTLKFKKRKWQKRL